MTTKAPGVLLIYPAPSSGRVEQFDIALYGIGRVSITRNSDVSRGGKIGANRPPSVNLLILQGERCSLNSDGSARRDSLSPR